MDRSLTVPKSLHSEIITLGHIKRTPCTLFWRLLWTCSDARPCLNFNENGILIFFYFSDHGISCHIEPFGCPFGYFALSNNDTCQQWLSCDDIKRDVSVTNVLLGQGAVKKVAWLLWMIIIFVHNFFVYFSYFDILTKNSVKRSGLNSNQNHSDKSMTKYFNINNQNKLRYHT